VAVVVAHDPGVWFEEALAALRHQDYPNLAVLVLDTGQEDVAARVQGVLPDAVVRRLPGDPGYATAANAVLDLVHGAAFFCFLHDDVAPDSTCIRLLVEEAYRSNAGVIGPKLVAWDDPRRLLEVGHAVDKGGVLAPYVERGELDQEQHDAVRDVFVLPTACLLVRADLFRAIGGFDPVIAFHGEDVDLCWRSHVAGARVMVNPAARARHREAATERRPDDRRRLRARHRLRTVLTCYGPLHLVRVVPQLLVLAVAEALYALVVGRTRQARDVVAAWPWNLRRLGQVRRNRRRLNQVRLVPDNEIRRLQVHGSARLTAFVRGQIGHDADRRSAAAAASRQLVGSLRHASRQSEFLAAVGLVALLVLGSRGLLRDGVPAVGELARFPSSGTLLRDYLSGWHPLGLGTTAPAPTATGLLGLAGLVTFGAMDLLRTLLVVLPLAAGWFGAYRMAVPLITVRARVTAAVLYAAIPLPYNALARGQWGGLLLYAAAPWVLARLARATALAPFGPRRGTAAPRLPVRSLPAQAVALGLLTAVVTAFVPLAPLLVLAMAVLLVVGSLLVGGALDALRAVAVAAGAAVVAVVLHLPWAADLLRPDGAWSALGAVEGAGEGELSLAALLRFQTGPTGAAPMGWAFLVVAALPLVLGRGWRLTWATRAWAVALGSFALAWAGQEGWFGRGLPAAEVLLAPAAAGLALAGALGMAAFEADLRGFRFGWRQVASFAALAAAVLGLTPVVGAAFDGRWDLPSTDTARTLRFLEDEADDGSFRVLWLGAPAALPMDGWWLREGLAYALSQDGLPDVRGQWAGTPSDPTLMVPAALNVAGDDRTDRLGRLLAPLGVKYVIVPLSDAPSVHGRPTHPVPDSLTTMLATQLDLERIDIDAAYVVYRNAAWMPLRALLDPAAVEASRRAGWDAVAATDLTGSTPVLTDADGVRTAKGDVPAGEIYAAVPASGRWRLTVDGEVQPSRTAFGWASAWTVDQGGEATLEHRTPVVRPVLVAVQVLLWLVAAQFALRAVALGYEAGASDRAARRRVRRVRVQGAGAGAGAGAGPGAGDEPRAARRGWRRRKGASVAPETGPAAPSVPQPASSPVLPPAAAPGGPGPEGDAAGAEAGAAGAAGAPEGMDDLDDGLGGPTFAEAWAASTDEAEDEGEPGWREGLAPAPPTWEPEPDEPVLRWAEWADSGEAGGREEGR